MFRYFFHEISFTGKNFTPASNWKCFYKVTRDKKVQIHCRTSYCIEWNNFYKLFIIRKTHKKRNSKHLSVHHSFINNPGSYYLTHTTRISLYSSSYAKYAFLWFQRGWQVPLPLNCSHCLGTQLSQSPAFAAS